MPRATPPPLRLAAVALALAVAGCAGAGTTAGTGTTEPVPPPAPTTAADTVFFDGFDGDSLDRSKWNVEVTGMWVNNEQQAYVDTGETLRIVHGADAEGASGGALAIEAKSRPGFTTAEGRKFDFLSGRVNTRGKVEFTYGTLAARMKLPAGAGFWPAFWALGTGDWPATGEIDVMENVGDPTWTNAAMHGPGYSGDTPLAQRFHFPAGEDVTGWHVYSADWSPDAIVFRVDDRPFYTVTRGMVEEYGRWAYDNPKFLIANLALGGGYPQAVNGVTGPHPGLPEESAARIREGGVRVLIDWVRVTGR